MKNFNSYLKNCRAILIFPEVYEGGFFFGAKGGNGLLLIRQSKKVKMDIVIQINQILLSGGYRLKNGEKKILLIF